MTKPLSKLIVDEFGKDALANCDCEEYPEDAYKEGEDLLTDDFARECRICGRVIIPEEFSDIIEEHDYEIKES